MTDWDWEWDRSIRLTSRERLNQGSFWDERTEPDGRTYFPESMTEDQISQICPGPQERILEIGPGNGRLTIPLARSAQEVTAVDPSTGMLDALKQRMRGEDVSNVRTFRSRWEDIDLDTIGTYDKVLSSYSLFMYDIGRQLLRMDAVADSVFLFVPGEVRIPSDVQDIMFGEVSLRLSDHEILCGLAHSLGLKPHAWLKEYPVDGFSSPEEAAKKALDLYNVSGEKEDEVRQLLLQRVQGEEGRYWLGKNRKVGAIWWRKD